MTGRVLSTEQAKASITKMKSIIDGGLVEQISALHSEGTTLSQPDVWDGQLAVQFRGNWQEMHGSLERVRSQLMDLQSQIKAINEDIMRAGGN